MDRVRVVLETPLFPTDGGAPRGAVILDGLLAPGLVAGSLVVEVRSWRDADGAALDGPAQRLLLPLDKVDHVVFLDSTEEP